MYLTRYGTIELAKRKESERAKRVKQTKRRRELVLRPNRKDMSKKNCQTNINAKHEISTHTLNVT